LDMPRHMLSRYTPRNRGELVACLAGLRGAHPVVLRAAAGELLRPYGVCTVEDVLGLPAWPYGSLCIVIERQPLNEVVIQPV
jgi:hypothetical protein